MPGEYLHALGIFLLILYWIAIRKKINHHPFPSWKSREIKKSRKEGNKEEQEIKVHQQNNHGAILMRVLWPQSESSLSSCSEVSEEDELSCSNESKSKNCFAAAACISMHDCSMPDAKSCLIKHHVCHLFSHFPPPICYLQPDSHTLIHTLLNAAFLNFSTMLPVLHSCSCLGFSFP